MEQFPGKTQQKGFVCGSRWDELLWGSDCGWWCHGAGLHSGAKGNLKQVFLFFPACWSHFLLGSGSSAAKGAVDSKTITQKEGRWWRLLQCICYRACVSKTSINLSQILNYGVVYPLSHPWNSYFQTESRHFKDRQKLTMTHCFRTP